MRYQKGSITIFALLAMLLVMTTLLSLLECSRYYELKRLAVLQTESATESVFARYSSFLWEEYHLLACPFLQMESVLTEIGNSRYEEDTRRTHLLLFQAKDVQIPEYTRLTDGEGTAYMHAVAKYMEKHILYDGAKEIFNRYEAVKNIQENSRWDIFHISEALEQLNTAKEQLQEEKGSVLKVGDEDSIGSSKTLDKPKANPLEVVQQLQKNGILELVLEDTKSLSEKHIALENAVSHRELTKGNQIISETEWMDKIFLQQYLLNVMSNFCEKKEERSLFYETEYLIGGKADDYENLKVVAGELLLIREAANFLYLMSDVEKAEEARVLAIALAGVSGNTMLVETIKIGILTAWAFAESILDVRALLQNQCIPLLKNKNIWTLGLDNIGEVSDSYRVAKETKQGLFYEDYLGILLLFQSEKTLAMRGMDVQEITLQKYYQSTDIYLDEFVTKVKTRVTYQYYPIFSSFSHIFEKWNYEIKAECNYSY